MQAKQPLSAAVIAVVVVIALATIGFLGYRKVAGHDTPQVTNAVDTRKSIEQLARQSGGDFTKLTPDEQKLLNMTYRGNGQRALRNVYKTLTASGAQ